MQRNDRVAIAVALAIHVVLLCFASRLRLPPHPPPEPSPSEDRVVEIVPFEEADTSHPKRNPTLPSSTESRAVETRPAAARANHARSPDPHSAEVSPAPPIEPTQGPKETDDSFDPPSGPDTRGDLGRSLVTQIALEGAAPPAPTSAPHRRPVSGTDVDRAVGAVIRANDANVGLGNREEHEVAAALQVAARKAPVPDKTHARFEFDIDASGNVTAARLVSASAGEASVWDSVVEEARSSLAQKPVDLGPESKRAGVRVAVDATVLHVYSNGTDGKPVVGECPKMFRVRVDAAPIRGLFGDSPDPFFALGGEAYGFAPNGTCVLQDAGDFHSKHIEVRTTTQAIIPNEPPPPLETFPKWREKHISLVNLIFGDHGALK